MAGPDQLIRFHRDDLAPALQAMDSIVQAGRGWMNFRPEVPEDAEPPPTGLLGFFSARGPDVPLCTWIPEGTRRGRPKPPLLGVQHATGPRTAARLTELGLPVPRAWRVTQDHPRRGLVLEVRGDEPEAEILGWLLDAGDALSLIRVTGWWEAAVYRRAA